jgi:hypothetical protein
LELGGETVNTTIVTYEVEEERKYFIRKDTYTVLKLNRFINFIIKFLLKRKVIKNYQDSTITFKSMPINLDKVYDLARFQIEQMLKRGYHPRMIIIGRKQQQELMCETEYFINYRLCSDTFEDSRLFGYEVILNPFMDGLIVI